MTKRNVKISEDYTFEHEERLSAAVKILLEYLSKQKDAVVKSAKCGCPKLCIRHQKTMSENRYKDGRTV